MTSFDCESGGGRWYEETLSPCERFWVCLALSHSEDVGKNASHVALARGLTEGTLVPKSIKTYFETLPGRRVGVHSTRSLSRAGGTLDMVVGGRFPHEHHDTILNFGRFPQRNKARLSRVSLARSQPSDARGVRTIVTRPRPKWDG